MSVMTPREATEYAASDLKEATTAFESGRCSLADLNAKSAALDIALRAYKADQARNPYVESELQRAIKSGALGNLTDINRGAKGLAGAILGAGWNRKGNPSVNVPGAVALKANVFPASTALSPIAPGNIAPLGRDQRWLWPLLPFEDAGTNTAVSDFVQTARSLTGTVERAIDATTTKANVDSTITASVEAIKQFAVTMNSIPNAVLDSVPQMSVLLNGEGQFQVSNAIDAHVLAQIVAATPAFGNTGTTTIDKVRNAIASMRALGANPNVLVLNPTDAAALDLFGSTRRTLGGGFGFCVLGG